MDAPMPLPDPSVVVSANVQDVNLADALLFDPDQYDAQEKYPHGTIDRGAPPLPFKYFAKEAAAISKMKEFLDIGKRLIARLYTYRSLGRSLPQVMPSHDDCTRSEIYQETHALLQPAVEKMKDLMAFRDAAVQIVVDVVSAVVQDASHGVGGKEKERDLFASTGFLSALAGMLSMFVVLDTMKNLKGSMNNDFSLFKRTIANLQQPGGDSVPAQNGEDSALHHRLYLFLAQQDQFGLELKRTLRERVPRFEDILIDVAHFCADSVESQLYLLQDTKHSYLKAAAFALFLMDDVGDERDLTKRKRFKLAPFFKLFKAYPIVPLYGDIPLALSSIYYKAPHLKHEEAFLNSLNANGINSLKERQMDQYNLLSKVSGMKKGLKEILARISKCVIEAEVEHKAKRVLSHAQNASIYRVAFDAVRFLAALTGALIEQNAWKLSNPSQPGPECDSASAYELAVQHNYSNQERGGLLEYVVAIRSLRAVLLQGERVFQPAITQYIYAETQSFIDLKMEEFALQGIKKKRAIGWILKLARLIGLNQTGGEHPSVSAVVVNDSFEEIPLSSTQLHFVRTFLDFASNAKSKGMKGSLLREKDFKDAQVVQIENFLNESFFYSHMQEWIDTIQKCSDLSDLWLKEFYLELSKRVQFPISASLPWILLECIIESQEPSVIELAFYPLEIYNDAAARSLYSLKNQCIYDEVLAELNLCFDQLVFRIAEHIFVHYKKAASRALLASTSRSDLYSKSHHKDLPTSLYDPILKQKVIKLVGRSIDLSRLLANLINEHIRRSLDIAISRYEASDLTFVVEFESLVNSAKKTHELLSQWLDLQDFGQILLSANRENELSGMGRIFSHTCRELVNDFIPNFCFQSATSTFIRAAISFIEPPQRPSFGKVPAQYLHGNKALSIEFALHHSDMRNFLSDEHFECIACIHSREEILMIVDTIAEHVDNLSKNALTDYVDTAIQGMPASLKLPLFDYGSEGAYDFFTAHLKPLLNYKYLHSEIFQGFREVGNSILAAKMLSDALDCGNKEICHIRKSFTSEPGEVQKNFERIADLDDKIDSESYPLSMEKWIEFVTAEELGRETGGALMARFMSQFSATILDVSTAWASKSNEDSSIFSSVAFFRFWCALQFVYCLSPSVIGSSEGFHGDKAMRELFGDGVPWAGLTILHSLGENGMFKAMDFNNHILSILRAEANKQASTAEIKGVFPGVPSPGSQSATQRPDFLFFVDAATFTEALSNDISRYFFFHFCVGSGY
ncbi:cytoplasmic fragile-X interacting family-domain-containing protein [Zopfochytrium polystomum]|nr:cytoplasmic fragile-X interacting family-domain-containing protein [Zopfochytrium polystomum]